MADLTREQFEAQLGLATAQPQPAPSLSPQGPLVPSATASAGPSALLPLSRQSFESQLSSIDPRNLPSSPRGEFVSAGTLDEAEYRRRSTVPGVEFDPSQGADIFTRLKVGAHRNKLQQLEALRSAVGSDNVRLDVEGNFVLRSTDKATGKPKDILLDEKGMSLKDFADVLSEAPALGASLLAGLAVPAAQILRSAAAAAGAYATAGAATDAVARGTSGQPFDTEEILKARGSGAIDDLLFGYGFGKGISALGSVSRMARTLGSKIGEPSREGALADIETARQAVGKRFGRELEPTLAELTGSPLLQRAEAFLSNIPVARNVILKKWQKQIDNEKAIQNAMLGESDPALDEVGAEVIQMLQREVKGAEGIVGKAADITRRQTGEALSAPLEAIPGPKLSAFDFGSRRIAEGEAQLAKFKAVGREKFDALRANPELQAPVLESAPIKKAAQALREEELVGKPATQGGGQTPIKALIPTGVDPILGAIDELPANLSYFDLVHLRQAIYDRVDSPEPISSRGTFLLKKLGRSVTEQLDAQPKALFSPATNRAVTDANKFWSDKVETFYQKGVHAMLKPRTEAGAIDPELLASKLLAGGKGSLTVFNTLKEFFETPTAVNEMKAFLRDSLLDAGTDAGTGLTKLEDLSRAVAKLEPEIAQELYGVPQKQLLDNIQAGQLALRSLTPEGGLAPIGRGTQAQVERDTLSKLLASGKVSSTAIKKLVVGTEQLRQQYRNSIRKAVVEDDLGVIQASPETFVVDYLANPKIPLADLKNVMQSVYRSGDAELIEDIRRSYLSEVFRGAAKQTKGDIGQSVARIKGSPLRELDPQKLAIQLEAPEVRARLSEVLGTERFDDLKNYALAISGRTMRDATGVTTGGFVGGNLTHKILTGMGGLAELPGYIAASWLITSPKAVGFLRGASKLSPVNFDKAIKTAVLSPEFMRVLASDAPTPEDAGRMAQQIRSWAAGSSSGGTQPSAVPVSP